MRPLSLFIIGGFTVILALLIAGSALSFYDGMQLLGLLLFWPMFLMPKVGSLDCANANSITDKLTCAGIYLVIALLVYAGLIYALLSLWLNRKRLP